MTPAQSQVLEFGLFRICPRERLLRRADEVIPLPPKAVDTLLALLSNAGRGVSKAELMDIVWPDAVVEEGGLARNISLIRKALGDLDGKTYIQTIPRRGYRFIAPVGSPSTPAEARQSLAVLPLDSVSAAPGDDYFAEGMTEALITQLTRLDSLRVCPRTTSALYRIRSKPLREIARELKVELVVEGSVLHADGQVRITVRLVRAADEKPLWSGVYERLVQDVLRLQSEVARDIAREFRLQLTGAEEAMLDSARRVNPAAYTHYLKGRYFLNQRTRDSLVQARESFLQAIAQDPKEAPAHAGLAHAYAMLGSAGYDVLRPHDAMPLARDAAMRALALDSASAEALAALGLIKMAYEWDFAAAERHLRMAAKLEPGNSTLWRWMGELALDGRTGAGWANWRLRRQHPTRPSPPLRLPSHWTPYLCPQTLDSVGASTSCAAIPKRPASSNAPCSSPRTSPWASTVWA